MLDDVATLAGYPSLARLERGRMVREAMIDAAITLIQRCCPPGFCDFDEVLMIGVAPAWVCADIGQALARLAEARREESAALRAAVLWEGAALRAAVL